MNIIKYKCAIQDHLEGDGFGGQSIAEHSVKIAIVFIYNFCYGIESSLDSKRFLATPQGVVLYCTDFASLF